VISEELIVDVLAAARLSRLVTADKISQPLRRALIRWSYREDREAVFGADRARMAGDCGAHDALVAFDDCPPWLAKLVTCPWCFGLWASFGVVALRGLSPCTARPVLRALALSEAAGILAGHETRA